MHRTLHKVNDPVEAVVITPVIQGDKVVLPAGTLVKGTVKRAQGVDAEHPRASLQMDFDQLIAPNGSKAAVAAQLVQVDNARESVGDLGEVLGILSSEALSSRMDDGLRRLSNRLSGLASVLQTAKNTMVKQANPEIEYGPGVEFTLKLIKALTLDADPVKLSDYVSAIQPEAELVTTVNAQPFQTMAEKPAKASDVTNLMFLGSREEVEKAFLEAGWAAAAALDAKAKVETLRAIVENRGYGEAPVSTLLLEDQKPDMVFEKLNNTFATRHHLRIWKRDGAFQGRPIWVCAATHDIGIDFSPENRTFIHKIDSKIDRERAKVVSDLLFTGLVKGLSLVDRPAVPLESSNATGDKLSTDGKMAVLLF